MMTAGFAIVCFQMNAIEETYVCSKISTSASRHSFGVKHQSLRAALYFELYRALLSLLDGLAPWVD